MQNQPCCRFSDLIDFDTPSTSTSYLQTCRIFVCTHRRSELNPANPRTFKPSVLDQAFLCSQHNLRGHHAQYIALRPGNVVDVAINFSDSAVEHLCRFQHKP